MAVYKDTAQNRKLGRVGKEIVRKKKKPAETQQKKPAKRDPKKDRKDQSRVKSTKYVDPADDDDEAIDKAMGKKAPKKVVKKTKPKAPAKKTAGKGGKSGDDRKLRAKFLLDDDDSDTFDQFKKKEKKKIPPKPTRKPPSKPPMPKRKPPEKKERRKAPAPPKKKVDDGADEEIEGFKNPVFDKFNKEQAEKRKKKVAKGRKLLSKSKAGKRPKKVDSVENDPFGELYKVHTQEELDEMHGPADPDPYGEKARAEATLIERRRGVGVLIPEIKVGDFDQEQSAIAAATVPPIDFASKFKEKVPIYRAVGGKVRKGQATEREPSFDPVKYGQARDAYIQPALAVARGTGTAGDIPAAPILEPAVFPGFTQEFFGGGAVKKARRTEFDYTPKELRIKAQIDAGEGFYGLGGYRFEGESAMRPDAEDEFGGKLNSGSGDFKHDKLVRDPTQYGKGRSSAVSAGTEQLGGIGKGKDFPEGRDRDTRVIKPKVDRKRTGFKTRRGLLELEREGKVQIKPVRNPKYYKGRAEYQKKMGQKQARDKPFILEGQQVAETKKGVRTVYKDKGDGIVPITPKPAKKPPRKPQSTDNFLKGRKVKDLGADEKKSYERLKKANQRYKSATKKYEEEQAKKPKVKESKAPTTKQLLDIAGVERRKAAGAGEKAGIKAKEASVAARRKAGVQGEKKKVEPSPLQKRILNKAVRAGKGQASTKVKTDKATGDFSLEDFKKEGTKIDSKRVAKPLTKRQIMNQKQREEEAAQGRADAVAQLGRPLTKTAESLMTPKQKREQAERFKRVGTRGGYLVNKGRKIAPKADPRFFNEGGVYGSSDFDYGGEGDLDAQTRAAQDPTNNPGFEWASLAYDDDY